MIGFNGTVMPGLYIDVSEMSIVGPPPSTPGGRFFFAKKQPSGQRFKAEPRAI